MNDLISAILYADEVVTVASFARNAGAGGVFMGLACDYVVGKEGVVLNPHYKTLGLSGSEYHTYTLPKRVGADVAQALLDDCLPLSVTKAKSLGMVDEVFATKDYYESLHTFAKSKYDDDFINAINEFRTKTVFKGFIDVRIDFCFIIDIIAIIYIVLSQQHVETLKVILGLARDVAFACAQFRRVAHVEIVVHIPEAVLDHGIGQLAVPQPVTGARLVQQIRRIAHALHAPGHHDIGIADHDRLRRQHHRLQAGAAHLVDGHAGDVIG